ncbi:hypothetical protein HA402_011744 [Bradysia odoriphaga]|nr:hypothetical protein HA402_011744 [Bradysia odoriphaga]
MSEPIAKRLRNRDCEAVQSTSTVEPTSNQTDDETLKKIPELDQSNSMYGLTDECLLDIFQHLTIGSLYQMANVCKRFRQIAGQVFARRHQEFTLKGNWTNSLLRRALCKFGHVITSIDASEAYFREQMDTNAIAKYCPTKLEKLTLRHATIDCAAFKPLFVRMKELVLDGCDFVGDKHNLFTDCKNLEFLYFDSNEESCEFVAQKYPKLSALSFDPNFSSFGTFFKLLALVPQITDLQIMTMPQDIYISYVVQIVKNLERLAIEPGMMSSTPEIQTKQVFLQLAKLKQLKKLSLNAGWETYAKLVKPLADAFAKGNVALDSLHLTDFKIDSKDIKAICNLKTLEDISLDTIGNATSADLMSLFELPLLTNLILHFGHRSTAAAAISADTLTKMIQSAKQIGELALVGVRNMKIGPKEYDALLKATVESRNVGTKLTIQIVGGNKTNSFNVPTNIQQTNIERLKIVYVDDDDD